MCDCGCFCTQPWWRPNSVACTVVSQGRSNRRATSSAARPRASRASGRGRSRTRSHSSAAQLAHVGVHRVDPAHERVEVLGELRLAHAGGRSRRAGPPRRGRCPPPRVSTWTSTPVARRGARTACGRGGPGRPRSRAGTPTRSSRTRIGSGRDPIDRAARSRPLVERGAPLVARQTYVASSPRRAAPARVAPPGTQADGDDEHLAAAHERAHVRVRRRAARRRPANASGRRARSASSREISHSLRSRRPGRAPPAGGSAPRFASQSTGRRLSGSTSARNRSSSPW